MSEMMNGDSAYTKREWVNDMGFEFSNLMAGEFDGKDLPVRFKEMLDEFEGIVTEHLQEDLDGDALANLVPDALVSAWTEYRGEPYYKG